jgi:cell division protein FtsB
MWTFWRRRNRRIEAVPVLFEYPTDARAARYARPVAAESPPPGLLIRRRGLLLAAVSTFLAMTVAAVFGEGGYRDVKQLRREVAERRAELDAQRARVSALQAEVRRLQSDPAALERLAREQLGLVRPGEISFLLPRESVATAPGSAP